MHQTVFAQTIDPSILNELKNRGVSGGNTKIVSPLDQARQQELQDRQERLLQQRKLEYAKPSRLEIDFQGRLDSKITQHGYSLFENIPSGNAVMTGTVPDTYKLGIGDELIITLQGAKSQTYTVKVDIEGRVLIPDLKPISVNGMAYGIFKSVLKKQIEESIIGTEVYISLASVRMISVYVVGEVGMPGVVRTSSLTTPIEVLLNAGGIKKTGSLRNISIYRGGDKTVFDIYDLLSGKAPGFKTLNDGDRIIVPTIGATIALDGEMVRPGIYELPSGKNDITFNEAMELAGGTIRPSGYEMSHVTIDSMGKQNFQNIGENDKVQRGEAIIARLIENSQSGKVELTGHVKAEGYRSLSSANSVNEILGNLKNLKENPYLLFGVIERVEEKTQTRQLLAFNPEKMIFGDKSLPLKDEDRVIFLGRPDIEFLISDFVRDVIVTGEYSVNSIMPDGKSNPKYCKPLKNLSRIINDTQSNRFATATRAVFVRKESKEAAKEKSEEQYAGLDMANRPQDVEPSERLRLEQEAKKAALELKEEEESQSTCPPVFTRINNLLPFVLEYIVSVDGAVRLPGVYPVTQGTSIASLMAVSGGMSQDANITNIEIANYESDMSSRSLSMKWDYINANDTDLNSLVINPGGGVRVGSKFSNFESGAVLLSGEFKQPGVYTIRKGEKLSELISRAGGITDQAYSYGAIFTRERVKEIQRAELRKSARHLQSAMVSASVKKNIEADSLFAAQQLTSQLANAELIGRVVIEADPVKLSLSPSLDTVLEAGDAIFMPKRPNFIIAMGDVLNPGALQFIPGKGVAEYIEEVGSYTRSADEGRVYIVYPNGVAQPITLSSWGGDRNISIPPGTAIVVPTDLAPFDTLSLVKEIGGIFQNLAVSAASIAVLIR